MSALAAAEAKTTLPPAPDVVVRDISKCFFHNDVPVMALRGVDLDVGAGEFVSVIGPSGCGKSTLLRLIGGLMQPDSGEIRVGGRTPKEMREEKAFGFVPQTPSLLPWLTVSQNVTLLRDTGKWRRGSRSGPQSGRNPTVLLDEVGLSAFAKSYPATLSGGMQQRVSLARAFVLGAPIFLMDEPFAALDEITRNAMRYQLLDIWSTTNTTVVFVTHSIAEAVMLSDRVVTMAARPGRIAAIETIDLPRPRTEDMEFTPQFTNHAQLVRQALRQGWGK